jgi:sporulation protein YlmC with PRC-barrel domain
MKTIQRNILISLVPLLTSLAAFAETAEKSALVSPIPSNKGSTTAWRASEVIGQNVKNAGNETIGEVQDLLVDMKSGEIHAVVVSAGGFLGIGDILTAVPVSALRFDVDAKAFKTKLTKEQLGRAPQFKKTTWPDYSDVTTMAAMRSYLESIGGDVTAPDNSAQNEKTENKDVLLPTDQGNSEKDIQITKDIRSSIINSDMSFNAKNIKIITKNESVILKGVVETSAEHQAILKIAKDHANAAKITDELKVNAE